MVRRHEITDQAWEHIQPLLPTNQGRGGLWHDHRTMLNGMIYKLATGCPWPDLPERYGPWQSVYGRYRRWANDGTIDRVLQHIQIRHDAIGRIEWEISIDSMEHLEEAYLPYQILAPHLHGTSPDAQKVSRILEVPLTRGTVCDTRNRPSVHAALFDVFRQSPRGSMR